jgi:hypothetical protein
VHDRDLTQHTLRIEDRSPHRLATQTMASLDDALEQASRELGLPSYYVPNVRPLLRDPEGRWPRCCGGGCEPCAQVLVRVALRTLELTGRRRLAPLPD